MGIHGCMVLGVLLPPIFHTYMFHDLLLEIQLSVNLG